MAPVTQVVVIVEALLLVLESVWPGAQGLLPLGGSQAAQVGIIFLTTKAVVEGRVLAQGYSSMRYRSTKPASASPAPPDAASAFMIDKNLARKNGIRQYVAVGHQDQAQPEPMAVPPQNAE